MMGVMDMTWTRRHALALLLAFGAVFFAAATAQAQEPKLGYVDLQRALNEVEDGKKAKEKLKAMFEERQGKLNEQQDALKAFKEKLQGEIDSDLLSDEKKREKVAEYQRRFYELQTLYATLQKELAEAEAKETRKIFARFQKILREIGLEKGYTAILEKTESSVLWAPKELDITDELIKRYNAGG